MASFYFTNPMAEQNPYSAPQSQAPVVKTAVAPVHRRHRKHPWEEPVRTQLADLARHDRAMLRYAAILAVMFTGIAAWFALRQQDFSLNDWRVVMLGLLVPVSVLLMYSVYQLIAGMDDSDSPLFMAFTALVPGFNLLLIFYCHNTARDFARDSNINLGWTGITPEEFAAQVDLAREQYLASNPAVALPVAEVIE